MFDEQGILNREPIKNKSVEKSITELNKRLCYRDNNSFGGYHSQLCGDQASVWRGEEEASRPRGQVQRHEPRGHHEGHRHGGDEPPQHDHRKTIGFVSQTMESSKKE